MTDKESIQAEITAQGDLVRKLKAAKEDKSKVRFFSLLLEVEVDSGMLPRGPPPTSPQFDKPHDVT